MSDTINNNTSIHSSNRTAQELAEALGGKKSGDGYTCCCPAHDDKNPSLSVTEKDGKVLYKCHARCSQEAVTQALVEKGLWHTKGTGANSGKSRKKKWTQLTKVEQIGRIATPALSVKEQL